MGCLLFVVKVGVEDVELVALHNLWRRVVEVVVGLVVLVPLKTRVDAIEISREEFFLNINIIYIFTLFFTTTMHIKML